MALQSECAPLTPASRLLSDLLDASSSLQGRLAEQYGSRPENLARRAAEVRRTLEAFLESHGDLPCAIYRAPARISLNPHCDHQGAWVPYGLHYRELLSVVAPTADDGVEITNVDASFTPRLSFSIEEEIARDRSAWDEDWFRYIEAPAVVASVLSNVDAKTQTRNRRSTVNYVRSGVLRLRHAFPDVPIPGLRLTLNGNITSGGGQSSSSALVVTVALALAQLLDLPLDRRHLAERCGEGEWYVGTRGGSGDQAAILLGSQTGLVHLRFRAPFGIRDVRYSRFPSGYMLVVANSQTRSEKGAEERLMFNRGIFAYRFAYLALREAMLAAGMPEQLVSQTECLGDLHPGRLPLADLYRLLLAIPEYISPEALAARYPETFAAAARGCFGTEDLERLPREIPLRGAAAYGLGRVDRGHHMPAILEQGDAASMAEFGHLMSVTHDGDRLFHRGASYTENRDGLSDTRLREVLAGVEGGRDSPLRHLPGFYGASIEELDRLVDSARSVEGVLGAGLMGAGGGGYVLILAREGTLEPIRQTLAREYYGPLNKEPDVEAWCPSAPACRLA